MEKTVYVHCLRNAKINDNRSRRLAVIVRLPHGQNTERLTKTETSLCSINEDWSWTSLRVFFQYSIMFSCAQAHILCGEFSDLLHKLLLLIFFTFVKSLPCDNRQLRHVCFEIIDGKIILLQKGEDMHLIFWMNFWCLRFFVIC